MSNPKISLLGPHEPDPFSFYNETGSAPVLVVCDHASRAVPQCLNQLGLTDDVFEKHVAWDIGTNLLGPELADALQAPAILAGYSRLVVDLNRRLDDPTAFIEISDGIKIPGNVKLSKKQRQTRTEQLYHTYHGAIDTRLKRFLSENVIPVVISVHSFTPSLNAFERPWEIGVLWDRDPRIARPLINALDKQGYCVGDNQPYSGKDPHDYTIDHHAEAQGLPYVSLEIRQDLITDPRGASKWAAVLSGALKPILADSDLYKYRSD
ncbi:MAG: N-formylglutamate amidohydrolase [Pseudomonadota bacterium]